MRSKGGRPGSCSGSAGADGARRALPEFALDVPLDDPALGAAAGHAFQGKLRLARHAPRQRARKNPLAALIHLGRSRPARSPAHIVARDPPMRTAAGNRREVDAGESGHAPRERRRLHLPAHLLLRRGRRRPGFGRRSRRRCGRLFAQFLALFHEHGDHPH